MPIISKQKKEEKAREAAATTEYPSGTSSATGHQIPSGQTLTVPDGITLWTWGSVGGSGTLVVDPGGSHVVV
jgi:hypothetical protein